MAEIPDRLYIDKKDKDYYDKLDHEEIFKSKGGRRTRKEQFLFAMAVGLKNNISKPLEKRKEWFLAKDLQPEDYAILNSVALNKNKSVDILTNRAEIFNIAEEYAHAGIEILFDKIKSTQYGSFDKKLEKELHDIFNEYGIKNK